MPNLGIQIEVRQDAASPAVRSLLAGLAPEQVNPIIGRSAQQSYSRHLINVSRTRPNKLGGRRTFFFEAAAKGTSWRAVGDHVVVSIASVGIRQRYFGGTIRPKAGKKFLTIPVHPKAYGKRAGEFDLEIVFGLKGEPIALATKPTLSASVRLTKGGRVVSRDAGRRGEIYYRLVRSVTQQPDPSVLPESQQVTAKALDDLAKYARLLASRRI